MKMANVRIMVGDCLEQLRRLPDESVQCCVTSPPYWGLRDYGNDGQIGLESTPQDFVAAMVAVFAEVRRVLRSDGVCFVNLGDSYGGSRKGPSGNFSDHGERHLDGITKPYRDSTIKPKDLCGIPWRVALALQDSGWWLRQDIIWHKPNPMPESVRDRCTKAHEYIFLLAKSARYYWDGDAIAEKLQGVPRAPGNKAGKEGGHLRDDFGTDRMGAVWGKDGTRNARSVWTITTKPYSGAHFATFPPELPMRCIKAGSKKGDTILDPFFGAGTTGLVAMKMGRDCIGVELNPEYAEIASKRIADEAGLFGGVSFYSEGDCDV